MAILKVGKKVLNGVATVSIKDSNTNKNEIMINVVGYMGNSLAKSTNRIVKARNQIDSFDVDFKELFKN